MKKDNKVIIKLSDANITRLAKKYDEQNNKLKILKDERDDTLDLLRDTVLSNFAPEDEDKTRIIQTPSVRITVNKRTVRNVAKTDMNKVFEDITDMFGISAQQLDELVERHTTYSESEIKPTVKVS